LVPALTVAEQSTAISVLSEGTSTGISHFISMAVGTLSSTPTVAAPVLTAPQLKSLVTALEEAEAAPF